MLSMTIDPSRKLAGFRNIILRGGLGRIFSSIIAIGQRLGRFLEFYPHLRTIEIRLSRLVVVAPRFIIGQAVTEEEHIPRACHPI